MVKAQQDMAETLGELGLTLIKLTKFENEEALFNCQRVRATDTKNLATAAVKASRFYRELNAQTVKHLVNYIYIFYFFLSSLKIMNMLQFDQVILKVALLLKNELDC